MGKWYEEAVFYHMYPLGMTGAPFENREETTVHRFEELKKWLPHIEELGCTAVYIGPLFESSTHGYDTRDYKQVDRRLGDNGDFRDFVREAHRRKIKVVVDGVFNHTGREFFAFEDIKKNREQSPYCNWYKGVWFGGNNCYNDGFSYESWRGCNELVKLNLWEKAVQDYLFGVIDFWIDTFDIDGIRLDCADQLEFFFMEAMRRRTEEKKADFWLMGEVIHGDYSRWVNAKTLHSVTNYELRKGLYSGHNTHNYFEIAHTIRRQFGDPWGNRGLYEGCRLYTFADNHDVNRLTSELNVFAHSFPVYALVYFLPGIPSVYYGSEFGIEGKKEGPDDSPMRPRLEPERIISENPHPDLTGWIRTLGRIHRESRAAVYGVYKELVLTNCQYVFGRILDEETLIVAVNCDENSGAELEVSVPAEGMEYEDAVTGEACAAADGRLRIGLEAAGCRIFRGRKEGERV